MKTREIGARIAAEAHRYLSQPTLGNPPKRHEYALTAGAEFKAATELWESERKAYNAIVPIEIFRDGAFVVRCLPYREAIERVAAKYAKGWRANHGCNAKLARPSLRRPPNADALLAALELELAPHGGSL